MKIFSAKYGNPVVEALGYPRLGPDEFISIPEAEVDALPESQRRRLPASTRKRLGFD